VPQMTGFKAVQVQQIMDERLIVIYVAPEARQPFRLCQRSEQSRDEA
jgi:hypothetical protein